MNNFVVIIVVVKDDLHRRRGITEEQRTILKETWSLVVPFKEKVAQVFYNHLFEVAPSVKSLFQELSTKKRGSTLFLSH
jgi:hemoglobin-like flavoprotein